MRSIRLLAAATAILVLGSACSDKGSITPPPDNVAPVASFTSSCATFTCTFTDVSTDADGTIASWGWDFGDGTTSNVQSPSHTYAGTEPASYNVTLTVTDNEGATNASTSTVSVRPEGTVQCPNGTDCTIDLTSKAIVTVTLVSADCQLVGNAFSIIQPIQQTIFTDGCFTTPGTVVTLTGPNVDQSFAPGTHIQAQFTQGTPNPGAPAVGTPQLLLSGTFPDWTVKFDDGGNPTGVGEPDFNDIVVTVHAQTVP
jgi:PKD repeat protein